MHLDLQCPACHKTIEVPVECWDTEHVCQECNAKLNALFDPQYYDDGDNYGLNWLEIRKEP